MNWVDEGTFRELLVGLGLRRYRYLNNRIRAYAYVGSRSEHITLHFANCLKQVKGEDGFTSKVKFWRVNHFHVTFQTKKGKVWFGYSTNGSVKSAYRECPVGTSSRKAAGSALSLYLKSAREWAAEMANTLGCKTTLTIRLKKKAKTNT